MTMNNPLEAGDVGEKVPSPENTLSVVRDTGPAPAIQMENKADVREQIRELEQELETIKTANSKLVYAKHYDIPPEAISDDVSMAGLSIEERQEKIKQLKDTLNTSSHKHWWQKAVVVGGMFLTGLFATKEASGQKNGDTKTKDTIENVTHSKEIWVKELLKYFQYLEQKIDTGQVTPEEMDIFANDRSSDGIPDSSWSAIRKTIGKIYEKHSPYALDGKKFIKDIVPGYDMDFGYDKDERILMNKILTTIPFDFTKIEDSGYENGFLDIFQFEQIVKVGNKTVEVRMSFAGEPIFSAKIYDDKGNQIAYILIPPANEAQRHQDTSEFNSELDKVITSIH